MTHITITWKAGFHPTTGFNGDDTDATFFYNFGELTDLEICNKIYQETNLYTGEVWEVIKLVLPEERTHTALSVFHGPKVDGELTQIGDTIMVDGRIYEVADNGWKIKERV